MKALLSVIIAIVREERLRWRAVWPCLLQCWPWALPCWLFQAGL